MKPIIQQLQKGLTINLIETLDEGFKFIVVLKSYSCPQGALSSRALAMSIKDI